MPINIDKKVLFKNYYTVWSLIFCQD